MNTIELNGLIWDTENLVIDGKTHFTYEEAKAEVSKIDKRLPTKNEFDALLQLHHVFDKEKHGMWFAKNQADLKSDKSLFLPASGFTYFTLNSIKRISDNGYYWSDTLYKHTETYGLSFSKLNSAVVYMYDQNYIFTVRCVSDIKQETMETKQEKKKSFKVEIPEGYEIDKENSTFEYIKYKKVKFKYPKLWEDVFWAKPISGFDIRLYNSDMRSATSREKSLFKTKKQAASALAYAQLTQLMALPCYNGDWVPDWNNLSQIKYSIERLKYDIVKLDFIGYFSFLTFKSEKVRDEFFNNHMDLIRQFYQL